MWINTRLIISMMAARVESFRFNLSEEPKNSPLNYNSDLAISTEYLFNTTSSQHYLCQTYSTIRPLYQKFSPP